MPERGHPVKCPPSFPDAGRTFGCGAVLARGGSEPGFPDPGPPTRGTVPRFPPEARVLPFPVAPAEHRRDHRDHRDHCGLLGPMTAVTTVFR